MTASQESIRLFNARTGALIRSYKEHGKAVLGLCLPMNMADNNRYASCSADRQVFLWDVASGLTLRRFQDHSARVNSISFNKDATLIASGSYDSTVKLWDCRANSRKPIQVLSEARDSVESVEINGTEIIAGSVDGFVRTYDVRTGLVVHDQIGFPVTCAQLTHDRNCLLTSTLDDTLRLFDRENGELLTEYRGHKNSQYRLTATISFTDAHVISGSEDGKIYMWDLVEVFVLI